MRPRKRNSADHDGMDTTTGSDNEEGSSPHEHPTGETPFSWTRLGGFVSVLAVLVVLLPSTEPAPQTADRLTAQFAVRSAASAAESALAELGADPENPIAATLEISGTEDARDAIRSELQKLSGLELRADAPATLRLDAQRTSEARLLEVTATLQRPDTEPSTLIDLRRRTGGWVAIMPPLLAVLLALFFRQLIVALLSAVWLGAALQVGFNPVAATSKLVADYLWGSVASSFNLYIIGFTFCLVGMVHVIIRMGGIAGLLEAFSWLANSMRSTRIATALMGLALFFDDYANTIVVGTTMRPLTDRQHISREKLAYLVDSTSAPIAGLAVISTWIGFEVGLFGELSQQLQLGLSGYAIFFEILPLRFYCILTLVFVFLIAYFGRDYGPMLEAERRAQQRGDVLRPGSTPLAASAQEDVEPKEDIDHRWYNAVVPVAFVIAATLLGMYWSGWTSPARPEGIPGIGALLAGEATLGSFAAAWGAALPQMVDWTVWRSALEGAANAKVLFWASVAGSILAIGMAIAQQLLDVRESARSWLRTVPMMGLAVAILVLAWSIQGVCEDLGTSIYLVGTVQDLVAASALPLLTFGLAAVVAFSTGTSWGTMGILLPAMIPLAFHLTADLEGGRLILMMCFGAVLDGAIFGDHCSPISDTTVMSSIASSVDHVDHVQTQLPYALTSMLASAAFGYLGVAYGLPLWAAFLLAPAALLAIVLVVGRSPVPADAT